MNRLKKKIQTLKFANLNYIKKKSSRKDKNKLDENQDEISAQEITSTH